MTIVLGEERLVDVEVNHSLSKLEQTNMSTFALSLHNQNKNSQQKAIVVLHHIIGEKKDTSCLENITPYYGPLVVLPDEDTLEPKY